MAEQNPSSEKEESASKMELLITVLLGVATVLGALAAYFAALWGGEMQSSYTNSVTATNHANTVYLEALNDLTEFGMSDMKDDIIYAEWKENVEKGDTEDEKYFFSKLSESLQKDLQEDPKDVTNYEKEQDAKIDSINANFDQSQSMHNEAEELMNKGNLANKHGDNFTLCTVLFTVVLFFLGLASLKTKKSIQKIYVIIACVVFVLSLIRMVTIPFPL